ncbi:diguanylate cyclase domain-containing protein [Streptomyces sp. NPDC127084]|uniref:diguanylate cyclase domain-containing protein n=1 Tax=Streptomyces sp. NPDC127084 TaxID=3347133 RepID=UPI00364AFABA
MSVTAGGVQDLAFPRPPSPEAGAPLFLMPVVATAGVAVCLLLGIALVVAATAQGPPLICMRRFLDGWLIAGCLFVLCWVLVLQRADQSVGVAPTLLALARVAADLLVLGLLTALRFCVKRSQRTAATLGVIALVALSAGDVMPIIDSTPTVVSGIPLMTTCSMTGAFLICAAPWLAGGGAVVAVDQRMIPVTGVVAAFVPMIVCLLALTAHALAGGSIDVVMVVLVGSVLVSLGVRQGVIHARHLRLTVEAAAREACYRTLVDGTRDVITIVGPDGGVLFASPAVYHVLGFPPKELVGARLSLYCHPDDLPSLRQAALAVWQDAQSDGGCSGRRVSCRVRDAYGRWRHVESTISHHPQGVVVSSRDVTDRVTRRQQLEHLAFHDVLTGLPNRALFADRVAQAMRRWTAATAPPAVLFVDLDGFKAVNDAAGHAAGDDLLVQAARRLPTTVRARDTVARFGGDEFAVLLEGGAGPYSDDARAIAEGLLAALMEPYRLGAKEAMVSASIGIAVATPGITPEELLQHADLAMYEAKAAGKGCIRMHVPPTCGSLVPSTKAWPTGRSKQIRT